MALVEVVYYRWTRGKAAFDIVAEFDDPLGEADRTGRALTLGRVFTRGSFAPLTAMGGERIALDLVVGGVVAETLNIPLAVGQHGAIAGRGLMIVCRQPDPKARLDALGGVGRSYFRPDGWRIVPRVLKPVSETR